MRVARQVATAVVATSAGFGARMNMALVPALYAAVGYAALNPLATTTPRHVWAMVTLGALATTNLYVPSSFCSIAAFAVVFA